MIKCIHDRPGPNDFIEKFMAQDSCNRIELSVTSTYCVAMGTVF